MKHEQKRKGSIYNNNGYWWVCVRLPGEKHHKCRPLCAPGSNKAMKIDRPRDMAVAAAHRLWEDAVRINNSIEAPTWTVEAVCDAFIKHSKETNKILKRSKDEVIPLRYLRECYGKNMICELLHTDLIKVRNAMIRHGYARKTINRYMQLICGKFAQWAFDEGFIRANIKAEFAPLAPLQFGKCEARETEPIKPVNDDIINATLAVMLPNTADMVRVHRLTGMRPSELCNMKWSDIDTSSIPWVYRPEHHKTEYRGQRRVILIGPKAREILNKHRNNTYPFSPILAMAELMQDKRNKRTSPFYPCRDKNFTRKKENAIRVPREKWDSNSYTRMIYYACKRANIENWGANRLRHTFATEVRKKFGLAACKAILGHTNGGCITDVYTLDAIEEETIKIATPAIEALG